MTLSQELIWQFLAFSPMEWVRGHCGNWAMNWAGKLGLNRREVLRMVNPDLSETMRRNPSEQQLNERRAISNSQFQFSNSQFQ